MLGVGAGECGECLADGYYANAGELGCGDWARQGDRYEREQVMGGMGGVGGRYNCPLH